MTTWGSRPYRPARALPALAPLLLTAALALTGCSGNDDSGGDDAGAGPDAREVMQSWLDASAEGNCDRATDLVVVDQADVTEDDVREQCESRPADNLGTYGSLTIEAVEVGEPTEGLGDESDVDNGQGAGPADSPDLDAEAAALATVADPTGNDTGFDLALIDGDWFVRSSSIRG